MADLATRTGTVTRLRAGVHVVQRDSDHVQIGVDPPARVIVRRRPEVDALIDDLGAGRETHGTTPTAEHVLRALDDAGLLEHGPAPEVDATVRVVKRGLDLAGLDRLLGAAGVREAPTDTGVAPDLYVVGATGPLPRESLDPWLGEGTPHLVLCGTGRPGSLRLGPFVEPGLTACLRCVDAHEAAADPRRPLVVEQLAALTPAPLDPLLGSLAVAWAAREVAAFAAGRRPLTWSATVDLDEEVPRVRRWERHPHCGCAWDVLPY